MRGGRIIGAFAALIAAVGVGFAAAPDVAGAASPADICLAIAAGTFNPNNYSSADIQAYQAALASDPTIQGYCSPIALVAPTCVEVPAGTPGAVLGANGKYYTNAPGGNGAGCGERPTAVCYQVPATTPGAVQAANGSWYLNAPGGNAEACAHTVAAPGASTSGVAGAQHVVTVPTAGVPKAGVKAATKAKSSPAPASHAAAPLAATKATGSLPFTGAELAVFAVVGLALLGGGFLLRLTARQKRAQH